MIIGKGPADLQTICGDQYPTSMARLWPNSNVMLEDLQVFCVARVKKINNTYFNLYSIPFQAQSRRPFSIGIVCNNRVDDQRRDSFWKVLPPKHWPEDELQLHLDIRQSVLLH